MGMVQQKFRAQRKGQEHRRSKAKDKDKDKEAATASAGGSSGQSLSDQSLSDVSMSDELMSHARGKEREKPASPRPSGPPQSENLNDARRAAERPGAHWRRLAVQRQRKGEAAANRNDRSEQAGEPAVPSLGADVGTDETSASPPPAAPAGEAFRRGSRAHNDNLAKGETKRHAPIPQRQRALRSTRTKNRRVQFQSIVPEPVAEDSANPGSASKQRPHGRVAKQRRRPRSVKFERAFESPLPPNADERRTPPVLPRRAPALAPGSDDTARKAPVMPAKPPSLVLHAAPSENILSLRRHPEMSTHIPDAREGAAGARPPAASPALEMPAEKGANDENFPVGSFLLPSRLRPHVARFYAFARACDDIADSSTLTADDKLRRLDAFEAALKGEPGYGVEYRKAHELRECLAAVNVPMEHAANLLVAFRGDAIKARYANWAELMDYCSHSANPVGRFLLDLHGESARDYPFSDALCTVLQVLNHIQDCGKDLDQLDRCYIPQDWMTEEGAETSDLTAKRLTPGMRKVLDRMLDEVEVLMRTARALPEVLTNRRLAMESATIVKLADRLAARLRKKDPLATRVSLSKVDFVLSGAGGILAGLSK